MKEYNIGRAHYDIMRRCYDPKNVAYASYGAKGIKVCDEWHDRESFRKWAIESGYKKGLRINRYDSNKDYCPENCFWGTTSVRKGVAGINKAKKQRVLTHKALKAELGIEYLKDSPLASTFRTMLSRCYNPKSKSFALYGGRGITVCDEWNCKDGIYNFLRWAKDSGWKPGLSLDRKDNDKGYSPDNCRWTTMREQQNNRRNNVRYMYKGFSLTLPEISRLERIDLQRLKYRVKNKGMTLEAAIADIKSKGAK